jgi:FAD binding domain
MRASERQSLKLRFAGLSFHCLSCPLSSVRGDRPIFCFLVFDTFKLSPVKAREGASLRRIIVSRSPLEAAQPGAGLGVCDRGLVIDLSPMKGVRVDPANRTVRVGPGCTQGDIDHASHAFGLAVPAGIVSTVLVQQASVRRFIYNLQALPVAAREHIRSGSKTSPFSGAN